MKTKDLLLQAYEFESRDHCSGLLTGLHSLWRQQLLCDVMLVASGESFQAHRVVLASCSPYFRWVTGSLQVGNGCCMDAVGEGENQGVNRCAHACTRAVGVHEQICLFPQILDFCNCSLLEVFTDKLIVINISILNKN